MTTRIILWLILAALLGACKNDNKEEKIREIRTGGPNADLVRLPVEADTPIDTSQLAAIVFDEAEFDFGEVKEGAIVEHEFSFENTGHKPLLIYDARSSCGCTVPEWPKDPIPPGGTGVIKARFDTSEKTGKQKKVILITTNAFPKEAKVMLKGNVK